MTNQSIEELMAAAGYAEVAPGDFSRGSDHYLKTGQGWQVFSPVSHGWGGGEPWGEILPDGLMRVPHRQKPDRAPGLHPATDPDAFEWYWPEDAIRTIFQYAPGHDADGNALDNPWVKVDDGSGNVTFARA